MANKPDEFFGRAEELQRAPRQLQSGSLIIDGPVGIGKSSFLSQLILQVTGNYSGQPKLGIHIEQSCDRSIDSPAKLSQRILGQILDANEKTYKLTIGIPKIVTWEVGSKIAKVPSDEYAIPALCDILGNLAKQADGLVVIAIDEADKCPKQLAQMVRIIMNNLDLTQKGFDRIRFILSGVSPFYSDMIQEDPGVARFFYGKFSLLPFSFEDSVQFIEEKFQIVLSSDEATNRDLSVSEDVYSSIARITGGHPHLLQLMGAHVLDHEEDDPDNHINLRDLVGSLRSICFGTRGEVYQKQIHRLVTDKKIDALREFFAISQTSCPTTAKGVPARDAIEHQDLEYLMNCGHVSYMSHNDTYVLIDEFLRIRMLLDSQVIDDRNLESNLIVDFRYPKD